MKKWKIILIMGCVILVVMPIVLIVIISTIERNSYQITEEGKADIVKSFGEPIPITRGTIKELIELEGVFNSREFVEVKIHDNHVENLLIYKQVDEEVRRGEVLASVEGYQYLSPINGKITQIDNFTIKIISFENLLFETSVNKDFKFKELFVKNSDEKLTMERLSNIVDKKKRKAWFLNSNKNYLFGEEMTFELYTGQVEDNVLTAPKGCVYSKQDKSKFYIRTVSESGVFIEEKEVQIGIQDDSNISIIGVDEGVFCDSGYKKYIDLSR